MIQIPTLGSLHTRPEAPEWLESDPIDIPFLHDRLPVEILELTDSDEHDAAEAINAFVKLTEADRDLIAKYLYKNYQNHLASRPFQPGFKFKNEPPSTIWSHLRLYAVIVSRRPSDGQIYLELIGECDWDPEQGIQIVFKQGNALVRVSHLDGHLTNADAFNLPGLDMISQPSREEMRMIIDRKRRYPDQREAGPI